MENPVTAITTKFVKTVYNKQRCPIFCTAVSEELESTKQYTIL